MVEKQNTNKKFWEKLKNKQNIHYTTVSIGQKSGVTQQIFLLWVSDKAAVKVSVRVVVISGLNWGRIHFQDHSCGLLAGLSSLYGAGLRIPFFAGCWQEDTLSSSPDGPFHRAAHNTALVLLECMGRARVRERASKTEITVFCN